MSVYEKKGKEITLDSGLSIIVHEEGNGEPPKQHDMVEVHYTGFLNDGSQFDSSLGRGVPFKFPLGQGRVIRGWDEGFRGLGEMGWRFCGGGLGRGVVGG